MKKVSVIIPLYNSEQYIAQTLESAINQSWPNKEIIVVDDGSTDKSYEIAKSFESYREVKVYKQPNSGACAARNFGFAKCSGDYIQYLDADDLLSADKIENQILLLQNFDDDILSSCPWGHFFTDPSEAKFIQQDIWNDMLPVDWLTTAWLGGGMMQTACWLTPRTLIEKAGPWAEDLPLNPNDDGEFFCRVLVNSAGVKFCKTSLVYYREHTGSRVSKNRESVAVNSLLKTLISYEKQISKIGNTDIVKRAIACNYASFIYSYDHLFPEITQIAWDKLKSYKSYDVRYRGGVKFKFLVFIMGFKNALKARNLLSRIS